MHVRGLYKQAELRALKFLTVSSKRTLIPLRDDDDIVLAAKEVYQVSKRCSSSSSDTASLAEREGITRDLSVAISLREQILGKTESRADRGHKHMVFVLKKCRAYLKLCSKTEP